MTSMLKKVVCALLSPLLLAAGLTSCGKHAMPVFENADSLAREIYSGAGFEMSEVYKETLGAGSAYLVRLSSEEYEQMIEDAVVYRKMVDSDGQALYVFQMKTEKASADFARRYYDDYEWAACDNAEKLVVACAGPWVIGFKSSAEEADTALQSFRALSGGALSYYKEQSNRS